MRILRLVVILVMALGLAACGSKFRSYNGPKVTQVQVHKADRKMYLLHNDRVLKSYDVALGFMPDGHKQFEGDGKTPEGGYFISHKNPNSEFHLSLGISYPNEADVAFAESMDKQPGGDIFIHGGPNKPIRRPDWTAGCIAVSDKEMEVVYSMIEPGTPIFILP
ncbi:MAG: L,D-transpeptidase family protein [Tabrizicola sp.]|uniref:L,D-transpeptidase family protein n=1 Tax=Tabrizicola sp. TaxID=2005166 RepID=UPI002736E162|nr:L,D-transpeptidase family protein [Tabrizicola sp.]MDP3261601.1 L,D-transpeptidase family protein [Tabrizicola sp.]MDP3648329.1 L,D-transpeptidase family protein [Paracoccaceae bacterium]MDZ4066904.1 L,D-transpeptidase family protein [Tabrizicola sp.]